MSSIKISVIICTYNGFSRGYLFEALNSVFYQTLKPDEIIVVNDGSTDETPDVLKSLNNIRLINKSNGGLPSARNIGILNATNDWIAFLDDDDIWDLDKLENQILQIKNSYLSENVIFASKMRGLKNNDTSNLFSIPVPYSFCTWPECLISNPVSGPSGVVLNKSIFSRIGMFNEDLSIGEDYEFWCRCLKEGIRIEYSSSVLFTYRYHQTQMTTFKNHAKTLLKSTSSVFSLIKQNPKKVSNKILAFRFLIGFRSLIFKFNFSQLFQYYRMANRPDIKYFFIPFVYIIFDSLSKLMNSNFLIHKKEKWFKKLSN